MSNGLMGRQELIQLQKTLTRQTQVACGYNCSACKYAPCIQFKIHQHVTPAMHSKGCWQCSHSCKSLARPLLRLCVSERARAPQHTPMFNTCSVKTDSHVQHTPLPNLYTYSHAVSELRKLGTSTFASMCVGKGKSTSTHASRTMRLNINAALECEPYAESPNMGALASSSDPTWPSAVQAKLQTLSVNTDPPDSDLSCFLECATNDIRTYFLLGNRWTIPPSWFRTSYYTDRWGTLSEEQYHKRIILAVTERIPIAVLNRLSALAANMIQNDHELYHNWNINLLECSSGGVGQVQYGTPVRFHISPGFRPDFLPPEGQDCNSEDACLEKIPYDAKQTDLPHLGSASLLHTATGSPGTRVLAASVAMTEADMVDILDYLCNAAFAWLNDAKSEQSYGSCDWTDSAFERLHWKLKMPQAAGVCKWATHLQFMLTPLEEVHVWPQQSAPSPSNEWVPEHLKAIHATHHAVAMSALCAIATLDPSQENQQEQANCNTDASSLQQLSSWSIPVPQLQQQAPPQPGVDSTHQHADLSTGTSIAGSASVLQVNTREVLGCGSTGIIFAGWYQDQEVAVKVSQPYYEVRTPISKRNRFLNEVWAYQQLQQMPEIYGRLVPELLAFVHLPNDAFLLVMTKQGRSLSDYVDENGNLPTALKEAVLSSLTCLHRHGMIHYSPRFDNITLKPGSSHVCFIDFQWADFFQNTCNWPHKFGRKYDSSLRKWRELTSAEELDEGAHGLTDKIMTWTQARLQEYQHMCKLLEQDYTLDSRDCATYQRARFPVDYYE